MKITRWLAIALLAVPLLFVVPGCATANKAAYKGTQAASISGDIGLRVWADYVSAQKLKGTPVPLSQELQVKKAWNQFEDAKDAAFAAGVAYTRAKAGGVDTTGFQSELNATLAAMAAAQSNFLTLIQSFGVKL